MSMRQRQSSLPVDEEAGDGDQAPISSAPRSRGKKEKKRRSGNSNKTLVVVLLGGAITLVVSSLLYIVFFKNPSISLKDTLPLRRSLFLPEIGASTKCQKELLLNRERLDKSLALGTTFLLHHQKALGNFDYEYDWVSGVNSNDDSDVRQAGALWGLSLIFHDMMDSLETTESVSEESSMVLKEIASRILRGIRFFEDNSKVLEEGTQRMRYLTYPTEDLYGTGTQALVCLALIDFARGLGSPQEAQWAGVSSTQLDHVYELLDEMLPFLVTQHSQALTTYKSRFQAYNALVKSGKQVLESGMWFDPSSPEKTVWWWQQQEGPWLFGYFYDKFDKYGNHKGKSSPYYDGESLLAITKAAKYLGFRYTHLWPMASGVAQALHKVHVEDALEEDEDSDDTKGVYQWLSMSLFELATVTFGEGYTERFDLPVAISDTFPQNQFGTWLVEMAVWMIDVHRTLRKKRNTGYAYEGIVPAWTWISHVVSQQDGANKELAKTARKLECTIEKGISKLIGWQVGMGAEENSSPGEWDGVMGLGGVQNAEDESGLRIDVTQHQMHATILTRRLVYAPLGGESWPWNDVNVKSQQS